MNLFNRLSLKSLFIISPMIALVLIIVLFFSSYTIIRTQQNLFQDLSQRALPHISELSSASVLLSNNHAKLTVLLITAEKELDGEQVFLRGKSIIHELHLLSMKFADILSDENKKVLRPSQISLVESIEEGFQYYKAASISAITLSTVNVGHALHELAIASSALEKLDVQILLLSKQHMQSLVASSEKVEKSLYDDEGLLVLTIIMIFIMLYIAVYFSSRLAVDLKQTNDALVALAKGNSNVQLPDKAGRYLEGLATIVQKLKATLQENDRQQNDLKKSISLLDESQDRYHQMFETNQAVKLIIDMESGKIVEANEAAAKFYGYDDKTLTTMSIAELNVLDDMSVKHNMQLASESGEHVFSVRHKLASGKIRDVEIYSGQILSDDKAFLYSIVHDVTERNLAVQALVESERKYRSIIQSTVVAIVVSDKSGRIIEWNLGAEHMFGYMAKEALGQSLELIMPERFNKLHRQGMSKAVENKSLAQGDMMHEISGKRKNGEEFSMELTLGSWVIEDDIFFSAMMLDVSERKRAELGLRRSQKMDAVGQLTGGIAHDFNNILGIILGNLELLERQIVTDEKSQKRINGIRHSAQRAADLTRQLLGFSRREADSVVVININTLINNMQGLIGRSLTPQVDVNYQLSENLWNTSIDPGDFEDALLNLVLNARDAMSSHGHLTIETNNKVLDEEYCQHNEGVMPGAYVELVISDNGGGIPHDMQERIFEPFFTTKEQGKGTGLGLAMVFGFVKRSKGSVKIYSEPGIGTTFRIFLPMAEQIKTSHEYIEAAEILPVGKEVILIVDDEKDLLDVAKETLQTLGYSVLTAENAEQALSLLDTESHIDLLFSDVVMPKMNGYELAEIVAQRYPNIKILLTSGYTEKAAVRNEQLKFGNNLISKPYAQAELARGVRAALDVD